MGTNDKPLQTSGVSGCDLVFLLLLWLKLTGQTDLSWWWVLAPVWVPALFALGVLAVSSIIVAKVLKDAE